MASLNIETSLIFFLFKWMKTFYIVCVSLQVGYIKAYSPEHDENIAKFCYRDNDIQRVDLSRSNLLEVSKPEVCYLAKHKNIWK